MEMYVSQFMLFILLFARIVTVIGLAPVLGHQSIPAYFKIAIGLFFSFVMFPLVSSFNVNIDMKLVAFVMLVMREVAVGLLLGFSSGIIFAGIRYAGELISFDMGFNISNVFDPETGAQTPVIGELLYLFTTMIFLSINGHHFVIQALQLSYAAAPIGTWTLNGAFAGKLVNLVGFLFIVGIKFAAPVIISLFLTNVALAILSRIMPQMNIFTVSFPLKIAVGMLVLTSSAPLLVYVFKKLLGQFENDILKLLQVL